MKKASLISFVIFFVAAGSASAEDPWWFKDVVISPENPTRLDGVWITLEGIWGDSCVPNDSYIWVEGNDIYFSFIPVYPPGIACLPIYGVHWELTNYVGTLSPGTYTVYGGSTGWVPYEVTQFMVSSIDFYVDTVNGDDSNNGLSPQTAFATIQAGIDAAIDGDAVIVADGTYTGDGNRNLDFGGKAITIRSENGPAKCIIDCESNGKGFTFTNDEDEDSIVDGFTITNGSTVFGGGIYCRANPIIRNCIIVNNSASVGGGICVKMGGGGVTSCPKIINCTFSGNTSSIIGGAIFCSDMGNPSVLNCILWGDSATDGPEIAIMTVMTAGSDTELSISYSNVQGGASAIYGGSLLDWGPGNIDADPLFVDPNNVDPNDDDYHLKSRAGRWDPNSESWVTDEETSPCIDAGNPGCPVGDEPEPNGNRINMGAYGGTAEASKSPANWALLADLTNDGIVDFVDLAVFFGYWPDSGQCVPADLNRSGSVDLLDYSILANQWPDAIVAEPQIQYEIAPCDLAAASFFVAEESLETRFTVTVEGRYIHFEDMMRANCCATALWLDMTVEDNLITIYEGEYATFPCFCICDYPVTATLGPFEEGTYPLEVYEDWGGFIGSTIVIIGPGG